MLDYQIDNQAFKDFIPAIFFQTQDSILKIIAYCLSHTGQGQDLAIKECNLKKQDGLRPFRLFRF